METSNEMMEMLRRMGVKTRFKPYRETETGALMLRSRRPAEIAEGRLAGSQIDLIPPATFRVWTAQAKKAKAYAARYGLRIRLLDGEAELFIPAHLADDLLRDFGARVKRRVTEAQLSKLRAHSFGFKQVPPAQNGGSEGLSPQKGI